MAKFTTCTNCSAPVAVRRPSASGNHYCQASLCQTAKQRFYRNRKAEEAETKATPVRLQLLHDVLNVPRRECPSCGLEDALPGWYHRGLDPTMPCFGVGSQGRELGPGWLDTIHPERVPGR